MSNAPVSRVLLGGMGAVLVLTGCSHLGSITSRPAAPTTGPTEAPRSAPTVSHPAYATRSSDAPGVLKPVLKVGASVPAEGYIGRPFELALSVVNKGDTNLSGTVLEVPVGPGISFKSATHPGRVIGNRVVWALGSLPVESSREVSCAFVSTLAGRFEFTATAKGEGALPVTAACHTQLVGVPALLLEKSDDRDPVPVGETTTYTVKVTNQGTAAQPNVQVVVTLPEELKPVSGTGECTIEQQTVSFPLVMQLAPKEVVSYAITARGAKAGDARTRFSLTADGLKAPVVAEESTKVY